MDQKEFNRLRDAEKILNKMKGIDEKISVIKTCNFVKIISKKSDNDTRYTCNFDIPAHIESDFEFAPQAAAFIQSYIDFQLEKKKSLQLEFDAL